MKLDKEEFMQTCLGKNMKRCVQIWDYIISQTEKASGYEYRDLLAKEDLCSAEWNAYKIAMYQFYGIGCEFDRTDEYYGIITIDTVDGTTDWLFKTYRDKGEIR